jgi:hypothetical protein
MIDELSEDKDFKHLIKLLKDPCPEEDCGEVLSPCCQAFLTTVFATLPVEVLCSTCQASYKLRDLIKNANPPLVINKET